MLKLAIDPIGKPRMTQRDKWKKRPAVLRYHYYCDALRLALPGYELPGQLVLHFHIAMPKSWSNKKRAALNGQPHEQKPDIDNLVKAFMDAFKTEDSHVHTINASKYWAEEGGITVFNGTRKDGGDATEF